MLYFCSSYCYLTLLFFRKFFPPPRTIFQNVSMGLVSSQVSIKKRKTKKSRQSRQSHLAPSDGPVLLAVRRPIEIHCRNRMNYPRGLSARPDGAWRAKSWRSRWNLKSQARRLWRRVQYRDGRTRAGRTRTFTEKHLYEAPASLIASEALISAPFSVQSLFFLSVDYSMCSPPSSLFDPSKPLLSPAPHTK